MLCSIRLVICFLFCSCIGFTQEARVKSIHFEGLKKSKPSYLMQLIKQQEGESYSAERVKRDLLVLLREPAVSHAYHSLDSLANGELLLRFHIEENSTLIPAVDLWQTVNNSFAYHLGVTDYNFLGKGYTLGGFYRQNNFPGFGIILENNNFYNPQTELKLIAQQLETLEPIKSNEETDQYRYRFKSIELSLGREINLKHKLLLSGGVIGERYLFHDGVDVAKIPNRFTTVKAVTKVGYQYDFLQSLYYQLDGWRNQMYFTQIWGESITQNKSFYTLENETLFFKRRRKLGNFAARLQWGLARNINSPFPPFAIDNNRNVRGAGNLVQRGNAFWALNLEYRHTLLEKGWFALQANAFVDLAGIQAVNTSINQLFSQNNHYRYGGIGLRFIHKYIYRAVVRIDYGINLKEINQSGLVFGIGQFF